MFEDPDIEPKTEDPGANYTAIPVSEPGNSVGDDDDDIDIFLIAETISLLDIWPLHNMQ